MQDRHISGGLQLIVEIVRRVARQGKECRMQLTLLANIIQQTWQWIGLTVIQNVGRPVRNGGVVNQNIIQILLIGVGWRP